MTITQRKSPNYESGRRGLLPDVIVCHITDGAFDGAVSWLTNPVSGVSAHFCVARDGRIVQMVDIADTAWANGTSTTPSSNLWHGHATNAIVRERTANANSYTISIEHEGIYAQTQGALTDAQLAATVWLIGHIRTEVKRLFNTDIPIARTNIIGHSEVNPRTRANCPGEKFPFDAIIAGVKKNTAATPAPAAPASLLSLPGHTPRNSAAVAWSWAMENKLTDGTNPGNNITREQMVTILHRYDGMNGKGA
jgi:N-acetyl-anhydromuramyl-L-alanine amidase AmpD